MNEKKKKGGALVAYGTGRTTKVPPPLAPYDFGINQAWFDVESENYPIETADYFNHPDPIGFGTKRAPAVADQASRSDDYAGEYEDDAEGTGSGHSE